MWAWPISRTMIMAVVIRVFSMGMTQRLTISCVAHYTIMALI